MCLQICLIGGRRGRVDVSATFTTINPDIPHQKLTQLSAGLPLLTSFLAAAGGGRNCGAHELICARRVSPELLGVLSSIAAFVVLMALFFLYLSNKLSVQSPDNLSHLSGHKNSHQVLLMR
ncbi:hypothetical protein ILYODFUR_008852 [Ilyodon furcidens]|uniref:Uncharacterized protein n=1 Tax=Ilyodon furcidens TaxID=33524 RepID=A0ABV0VDR0_9TELE